MLPMQRAWVQSLVRELDPSCLNLKIPHTAMKISHATNKTQHSQIRKKKSAWIKNETNGRELGSTEIKPCTWCSVQFSPSVQFSCSVVSDSLQPHESRHARLPCPSPSPGVHSNSCPLSRWCSPTMSSSVLPFTSRLQSFPASGSFPLSQFFTLGGQSIGVSALASVLPKNTQDWSLLEWTSWISLQPKRLSRVFSNTTVEKHQFFSAHLYSPVLTSMHDCWKNNTFD